MHILYVNISCQIQEARIKPCSRLVQTAPLLLPYRVEDVVTIALQHTYQSLFQLTPPWLLLLLADFSTSH